MQTTTGEDLSSESFDSTLIQRLAALYVAAIPNVTNFILPFILGAVMRSLKLSADVATYAITAEVTGLAITSLLVSYFRPLLRTRSSVALAALLYLSGQLISLNTTSFGPLIAARALAGIGDGVFLGMGFAILGQMKDGAKLFSFLSFVVVGLVVIAFFVLPLLGPYAVFVVLAAAALVALLSAFLLPDARLKRELQFSYALFTLGGFCLFIVALGASIAGNTLWLYFEGVGEHVGMPLEEILDLGTYSLLPVLAVPWAAFQVHRRTMSTLPLMVLLILMAVFGYYYATTHEISMFVATIFVLNAAYVAVLVYSRILAVDYDDTGRLAAAVGSADVFGLVIGPLLATAMLNLRNGYTGLGIFAAVIFVICLVPSLIFAARRKQ